MRTTWALYVAIGIVAMGGQIVVLLDERIPARPLLSALLLVAMGTALIVMVAGGARSPRNAVRRKTRR